MARIKTIPYEEASGNLKRVYDDLIQKRGRLAKVMQIQSLHPGSMQSHMALYLDIMFSKTSLSRAEKEMIAVVVSTANGCKYCQTHHSTALNHYWRDGYRVAQLQKDYCEAGLCEKDIALCEFATHLTRHPETHEQNDQTMALRKNGLSDAAILDVVLVTSYFNFVNRMVLALGVQLEEDNGDGFNY
ncbi:MAG: peroxidase-related enzyme [Mucilaginibacter sp.]